MPGRDSVRIVEGQRVKLKPIGINHSQLYNVTWHFTLTKAMTDDDIISFGRTTIGVEIQAHFNPQELRVEIDCDEFGVEQLDEFTWKAPNKHALFVERQHIEIKWKPIKQDA